MKYSTKFEKDYEWYLSIIDIYTFDGVNSHVNKNGIPIIQYDINGKSAKECFYRYDSDGVIIKTNEPTQLEKLLRVKGSVNLHIKMFAEDRANGILPKVLFNEIVNEINAPIWFIEAVENQKYKYYDKKKN